MCPQKLINVNGLSIGFDQMSFDWIDGLIDGAVGRLAAGATMQQCLAVHEIPLCQIYLGIYLWRGKMQHLRSLDSFVCVLTLMSSKQQLREICQLV